MKSIDECKTESLDCLTLKSGVADTKEAESKLNQSITDACEMMVGTRLIISAMFEGRTGHQDQARTREFLIGWSDELLDSEHRLRETWEHYTSRQNGS